jgi:hypothetical protein
MKAFNYGNLEGNTLVGVIEEATLYGKLEPVQPISSYCTIRVQKRIDALLATAGLNFFKSYDRYYVETEFGLIQVYNVCERTWINSDWGEQLPVITAIGTAQLILPDITDWELCLRKFSTQEWYISKNSLPVLGRQYHLVKGSEPLRAIIAPTQAGFNSILVQSSDRESIQAELKFHEDQLQRETSNRLAIIAALKAKL